MPQLDKFTYFTQFFQSCLILFTFYVPLCNDGDGILGISRILKLRNQLISHQRRGNSVWSNDPNSLEDISRKCFSIGVSYMYSCLFEVSQWCNAWLTRNGKKHSISDPKSSYSTSSSPEWGITCQNDIMLIHVPHGQGNIYFGIGVEPSAVVVRCCRANILIDMILY
ncbi:unnamed protein product [Victoria cruziana]